MSLRSVPGTRGSHQRGQAQAMLFFGIGMLGLAVALVAAVTMLGTQRGREAVLRRQVDSLRVEVRALGELQRRAAGTVKNAERERDELRDGLDEWTIKTLRQVGFADPVRDIKRDLMSHPELIPYPGVEGGRMGFYSQDGIRILNDHWAVAEFEDGHVGGWMLLRWRNRGTKIVWTRIDAYRD